MKIINPALGGRIGSSTRQLLDGAEWRINVLWLDESINVPFMIVPPPPLVFGADGNWTLTIAQADGTVCLAGMMPRHGVNILAPFIGQANFPGNGQGRLLVWDFSGRARDPGRNDLDPGSSIRLVYLTAAEADVVA